MNDIEKIDLIKQRLDVSYKKARDILQESGGDVVQALIKLEDKNQNFDNRQENNRRIYKVKGKQLLNKIKKIIREGNARKIIVKDENKTLVEIPITAGIIGLALFPYIGILAGMVAMYKDYILEIEKKDYSSRSSYSIKINPDSGQEEKTDKREKDIQGGQRQMDIEDSSYSSYKYEYE